MNGVIRQFAFGENGKPFDVDVNVAIQEWTGIEEKLQADNGTTSNSLKYYKEAIAYTERLSGCKVTTAEAIDFIWCITQ